jgi:hypothetical protein
VRILGTHLLGAIVLSAFISGFAAASPIAIANPSFETLPPNGLPFLCGGSCAYSNDAIPGWNSDGRTGQWITGGFAGNPNAIDGSVLAASNFGSIWQDAGPAVFGFTYTLRVARLHRTDVAMAGEVRLVLGGVPVATAIGPDGGPGAWNEWTAVYTPSASEAGRTLTILLSNDFGADQANFDNVRLDAVRVPEPVSFVLIGAGMLGLLGLRAVRIP